MHQGVFKSAKLGLGIFCFVFLSACANDPNRVGTLSNPHRYIVPAPSFELSEEPGGLIDRRRVSKIDVVAPTKGQQLVAQGVSIRINNGQPHHFAARYFLEEDYEPIVRQLLAQRYEIDPAAEETLFVEVLLSVESRLSDDWLCKSWITNTRIAMNLTESKVQSGNSELTFGGTGEDKTCPVAGNFTSPESIGKTTDDAFQEMADQLLEWRAGEMYRRPVVTAESE